MHLTQTSKLDMNQQLKQRRDIMEINVHKRQNEIVDVTYETEFFLSAVGMSRSEGALG